MNHIYFLMGMPIILCSVLATAAYADAPLTATQQIVPMNCIVSEVNDGLSTVTFIAPAACRIVEPQIQRTLPASRSNTVSAAPQSARRVAGSDSQGKSRPQTIPISAPTVVTTVLVAATSVSAVQYVRIRRVLRKYAHIKELSQKT